MKVSMDGLRKSLAGEVIELKQLVEAVLADEFYENKDLQDAMNDVVCSVNCLACTYDDENELFNDLGDEIDINIIEHS
jgi:hypothetical protein